ncbi:MAG: dTMP kinase, partial [Bacilli bacterium]
GELDKVEDRGLDYFRRVRDRYLERAWDDKNRWHVIDATLKEQEVFNQVSEIIDFILRQPPVFG